MIVFRQLFDPQSSTYTYLLGDLPSGEAVLIDPVFEHVRRDSALLRELGLTLVATLDTHVHADHVTGAWLLKKHCGSQIGVAAVAGAAHTDRALVHGDRVAFGTRHLEVRATPGHTNACLTFVLDDHSMAFTGDCLLIRGSGRTDFQQGDALQMYRSVHGQILTLPEACLLYPAHDYRGLTVTSVSEEKRFNPRLGGDSNETDFAGYMSNLGLPHPKLMDMAVPANLRSGRPEARATEAGRSAGRGLPVFDPSVSTPASPSSSPADGNDDNDDNDSGALPTEPTWAPLTFSFAGIWEIQPAALEECAAAVSIIDVREPAEFNDTLGHIAGARLIPLSQLSSRLAELPHNQPIVTVCRSGARSAQASVLLQKAGFSEVANLAGGLLRWRAQQHRVQAGLD